jgi:hypothetical protein
MLSAGDEKVLVIVHDNVHVKPLSRMCMLHRKTLVLQCAITVFPTSVMPLLPAVFACHLIVTFF